MAGVTTEDAAHSGFPQLAGPLVGGSNVWHWEALAGGDTYVARDVFVLDCANSASRRMLSALPDLRVRNHSRDAAILVMHSSEGCDGAITALTSRASDLVGNDALGDEVVHRGKSLMRRKSDADDLRRKTESSMRLAATDPFYDRRYADPYLADVMRNPSVTGEPFAVIMADIDHFPAVTDEHGQAVGVAVLREIGNRMRDNLGAIDLVARSGGEEFLVDMPGTDGGRARPVANRLRVLISDDPIVLENGADGTAMVSAGVTVGGAPQFCASGAVESMIDATRGQNGGAQSELGRVYSRLSRRRSRASRSA